MERWIKPAFAVIGIEGATQDGAGFVQQLWTTANSRFDEVAALAKRKPDGSLAGIWGAMTDMERRFAPWTAGFTCGRYLAGVECRDDAAPPPGWTRWDVPGFEYVTVFNDGAETFSQGLEMLRAAGMSLAGAVQEFTDPVTGQARLCYPIRRLDE